MNLIKKIFRAFAFINAKIRVYYYNQISDILIEGNKPSIIQPQFRKGTGRFICGHGVQMGVHKVFGYFEGLTYIDLRAKESIFKVNNNVTINNNFRVTCASSGIEIGDNTLIGVNVQLIDADFHSLDPQKRTSGEYEKKPIVIGKNVWIGNNVIVLKGVQVGDNSIIAANSVVVKSIPENSIAAGNPAKVVKELVMSE